MKLRLLCLAFAAIAPIGAFAQFDFGGGGGGQSKPAWESFKLPNKTMKLDFRNSSIDMVLALYTKVSGITIIKDPNLKDNITLTTARAVPISEAFEILSAALSVRNYEIQKNGNVLVVRGRQRDGRGGFGSNQGGNNQGGFGSMTPEQIQQMMQGAQGSSELRVYRITYANASQVARVVNDVFQQQFNLGGFNFGGGNNNRNNFGRGGNQGRGNFNFGGMAPPIRASSDDYSNTVIVNAPSKTHTQIADLIKEIDKQTEEPQKSKVYPLTYATADTLQPVLQNVLQSNMPRGRGGATGNQTVDQRFTAFPFFGGGFGQQQRNQAAGSVVSEMRTNSLVVTTTENNQKVVEQVLKELDKEVKLEATTFVFPLANARADQVATLFRQAFGNRSGMNNAGGQNRFGGTNNNNQNRNNNPFGNNNRGGGGGTGAGFNIGGNNQLTEEEIVLALSDPNAANGDLATNVGVTDGMYNQLLAMQQGGGQQNRQGTTTGRTQDGRLIQTQDLTNQITVIPDQNTNSLIVVASPENAQLLQQILGQLDKIPEQVMIETIIVEASLDAETKLGFEWQGVQEKAFGRDGKTGTANQDFGLRTGGNPQGFRYTLTGGALTGFLNAMQTDTRFNVLSTPRIFTSNNVQAQINISQRVPFVVSQRTDANGNITFNYDFEDVGIVLTVTPRITSGGYVTMDVQQTANDLQGFTSFNAPIVNQRQAQTTVAVQDGHTVILGGIMRSTVSSTVKKIPLLGDIPILGNLFRSTSKNNQKTELLVFMTPRVVRNPEEASSITDQQKSDLSKQTQKQLGTVIKPKPEQKSDDTKKDDTKKDNKEGKPR